MRVRLTRTGGVAGVRRELQAVTTDDLPQEEGARLEALVRAARLGDAPSARAAQGPRARGADRFTYELTVEEHGVERSVRVAEGELTAELRELVQWLQAKARGGSP